ncbi:MAG: hypothetical protein IIW21_07295 [Clostridia bacterium]|nr:hypothetical protein [Clostridia bacterium]
MQSTVPTEKADRIFEIEINGNAVPCAEAHILCALPEGIHGEIPAFYARLCEEFILYAEKTLAPEFAERFASTETLRERCALKIPVLTVKISAQGEETLTVITKYTLAYSARDVKRNEIRTEWDAQRGIMVKKRANKKGST